MLHQSSFDLFGFDPLAADLNLTVESAEIGVGAVLLLSDAIAGAEEPSSVAREELVRVRVVEVAERDSGSADDEFAVRLDLE